VAGVPGTAGPAETREAIAATRLRLLTEQEASRSPQEQAEFAKRLQRLQKAEEILLNPDLKRRYLEVAHTMTVRDSVTGRLRNYRDILQEYSPAGYRPPQPASGSCKSWFANLFR
jgi:curved DNA-binding protein CbpA